MTRHSHKLVVLLAIVTVSLAGCAAMNSSSKETAYEGTGEGTPAPAGEAKSTKPPMGVAPPSGSAMSKVAVGMAPPQVREILGEPTNQQGYMTGKAWIPFYFGPDTHRLDYKYEGLGRVVFSTNRWSGNQKVVRVDYDPAEDGI